MFSGKEPGDRSQNGQDRGAQRHPRNPRFAAVFGAVMNVLLQIFKRNFTFFHRSSLRSTLMRSRRNRAETSYKTNIAAAAPNITSVIAPTAMRDNQELGCPSISLESEAAMRTPTIRNGASTPLITAVQKSALTGLMLRKSIPIPSRIEKS